jgi:hypothetical protein
MLQNYATIPLYITHKNVTFCHEGTNVQKGFLVVACLLACSLFKHPLLSVVCLPGINLPCLLIRFVWPVAVFIYTVPICTRLFIGFIYSVLPILTRLCESDVPVSTNHMACRNSYG